MYKLKTSLASRFFSFITYLYLLRFSLITLLFLILFPYIALKTSAASLLENLFDLSASGIALVVFNTMLASWSVMVTSRLVLLYSSRRFVVQENNVKPHMGWKTIIGFVLPVIPMITGIYWELYENKDYIADYTLKYVAPVAGIVGSFIFLFIADRVHRKIDNPATNKFSPDLLLPANRLIRVERAMMKATSAEPPAGKPSRIGAWLRSFPPYIGDGYIDYDADPRDHVPLLPGHGLAIGLMITFIFFYIVVGIIASPWVERFDVPALAYMLLLITMLNWILGGAAFFFDRFRVPMLALILLWFVTASAFLPGTDSYYFAHPTVKVTPGYGVLALPQFAMRPKERGKLIVVAANGGGIQSAAWTARVLTGLEKECRKWAEDEPNANFNRRSFGESVKLISGVSGGSVGAMYFINAYDEKGGGLPDDDRKLEEIVAAAQSSSLDSVSWGLVYPDFIRSIMPLLSEIPIIKQHDRGRTLELAWQDYVPPHITMSKWSQDVSEGKRPAVIFNTTIADTGEPLLFSTIDRSKTMLIGESFDQLYKGYDIPVTTAVRLSATFPYVTPAARIHFADGKGNSDPEYHIVDGGYYDNYGIAVLVESLDATLLRSWRDEEISDEITDVLIIRIHGAPTDSEQPPDDSRGWLYQAMAPVIALNTVRGAGQRSHSNVQLDLFRRAWDITSNGSGVRIDTVTFEFDGNNPPMSWHLSEKQKRAINDEWKRVVNMNGGNLRAVKRFIKK